MGHTSATAQHPKRAKRPSTLAKRDPSEDACNGRLTDDRGYCTMPPGWGTEHVGIGRCKRHGGSTKLYQEHVERKRAVAVAAEFGISRHTDPFRALEEELDRSAGLVDFYMLQVRAIPLPDQMHGPVGGGQGAIPEHKPNVWIVMLDAERDRFRRIADTCIKAGIAQRRVEIAEQQGQLLAAAVKGILMRCGIEITPDVAAIVREEFLQLSAAQSEAVPESEPELVDA